MRKTQLKELISEYQQENRKTLIKILWIFLGLSALGMVSIILVNLIIGG